MVRAARPRGVVLAVLLLIACIVALRLSTASTVDAPLLLLALPILLLALDHGRTAGLLAAAAAIAIVGAYATIAGSEVGWVGWLARAGTFLGVGFVGGLVGERLRRTESQLDRFFAISRDLLCIADAGGRLEAVNPAWTVTLGWSPGELRNRSFLDLVHPDDRRATVRETAGLADGGETSGFSARCRTRDGGWRWLEWKARGVPEERRIYAWARDTTRQREEERRLCETLAQLQRSNAEFERLTYVASHDLSEPLRALYAYADLVTRNYGDAMDERGRGYLANLQDAVRRLQTLIDDVLAYSRAGRRVLTPSQLDMTALARRAAERVMREEPADAAEIVVDELPPTVGDEIAVRTVFEHLLSNAVKFTDGTPRVRVEGTATPDGCEISIADNGIGIEPKYADRIFEVFQRLHPSDAYPGTGIGLAICRRLVERHNGRIWIEPNPTGGTVVRFSLQTMTGEPWT